MAYTQIKALTKVKTSAWAKLIVLLGIATFLPFFIHFQWFTGPIINAVLILSLFLLGIRMAMLIALIPSMVALSAGLLPAVLAPAVPFIMLGNMILILTIDALCNNDRFQNYWKGLLLGAGLKFMFLFASISVITKLLLKQELAGTVTKIMSWPQFATAIIGGMIAWMILKWLRKV